jgi:hypothetical protein
MIAKELPMFGDPAAGRVKEGWLLLARSGQIYGLNGSSVIATKALEGRVISDHVIRIARREQSRVPIGYIHVALSHPRLGRPLVKSLPYGSSVPEIEPADCQNLEIVRLAPRTEEAIADLSKESAALRASADILELLLGDEADLLLQQFVTGEIGTKSMEVNSQSAKPSERKQQGKRAL